MVKGASFNAEIDSQRIIFQLGTKRSVKRTIKADDLEAVERLPNGRCKLVVKLHKDLTVQTATDEEYSRLSDALNKLISDVKVGRVRSKQEAQRAKLEREGRSVNKSTVYWWYGRVGGRK